jgi:hypothetical protein
VSELLQKAFERIASELPEYEQDQFAKWLLEMIESDDRQWEARFAASLDKLSTLGDRALAEFSEGRTEVLDPEKL